MKGQNNFYAAINVAFEQPRYSVNEEMEMVEVCVILIQCGVDDEKTAGVEVGLSLIADTATSGEEYMYPGQHMVDKICC